MAQKEMIVVTSYTETTPLTLTELCEMLHVPVEIIHEFVSFEIIHPQGDFPDEWVFDLQQLQRIKTALRLKHDLEVNLAGIALVLDLLDELDTLRARAEFLEKHLLK
jgi:chaperone modulatory protein CbpM